MATKRDSGGAALAILPKAEKKVRQPPLWRVILHNDDFTTQDFVVWILQSVFHKQEAEAVAIMLRVHKEGVGVAGIYPHELAETKVEKVRALARQNEYPLRCTMEPE